MPGSGTKQDTDILKVAIKYRDMNALLKSMSKKQHLSAIIQEICSEWSLPDPDQFALKFSDRFEKYITEENRDQISNGLVLMLMPSPSKTVQNIMAKLCSKENILSAELMLALKELLKLSADITFAKEWIDKDGAKLLMDHIEGGVYSGNNLAHVLHSFLELMEHNVLSWEIISNAFIQKVAFNLTCTKTKDDPKIVQTSLALLDNILLNSPDKGGLEAEKSLGSIQESLLPHLHSKDPQVQQNCITLIKDIFQRADPRKRKRLAKMIDRYLNIIYERIIHPKGIKGLDSEMAHQLYVLQSLLLNQLEKEMNTPFDIQNQDHVSFLIQLQKVVVGSDEIQVFPAKSRQANFLSGYKKLGFDNDNPVIDLQETPPGILAVDSMIYYASHKQEECLNLIENCSREDERGFPFGRSSVELTKLLCEILKIGEPPNEEGTGVLAIFFSTKENFFLELFCVCIALANKTWKEMEAAIEDFPKVFVIVREQITRALHYQPATLATFREDLKVLTYAHILKFRKEANICKAMLDLKAKPIMELREEVTPEIKALVRKQRLGYLVDGTRFRRYNDKGQRQKNAFMFWKLSQNHKVFHYGDCNEKSNPTLEELTKSFPVGDIEKLLVGQECPHVKVGKKVSPKLAFAIVREEIGEPKNDLFMAPDQKTFDYWTDGISALLGHEMASESARDELEILLNMDIKLRLLDIEGIDIPQEPPPIPEHIPCPPPAGFIPLLVPE